MLNQFSMLLLFLNYIMCECECNFCFFFVFRIFSVVRLCCYLNDSNLHYLFIFTNHIFSTHFWGPIANWGIPIAALADIRKSPDMISGKMTLGILKREISVI